jgi:tricarballylate dehydrogenase
MTDFSRPYDLLVIGGGNAALCAAITAREAGASVLLLEAAPKPFRGGNSRHTRNLRCMHDAPIHMLTESYPEEEYFQDLLKVTGGQTSEKLARMVIRGSVESLPWMIEHGVRFQPSLGGTLHLSRTNAFFLGGGKALLNAYYHAAERIGIDCVFEAEVQDLAIRDGRFESATVKQGGGTHVVRAKAVVIACGGFQADIDWLKEAWGPPAENFIIRGTPYNRGRMLRVLMDKGAKSLGDPTQCHAVAIDARSPKYDGGIITRVDAVSLGIVVNKHARRFYDEGEDFWPKRYAIWGRLVAGQPDQIAYSIIDSKAVGKFMPPVFPPVKANSIRELATAVGLEPNALEETVNEFNAAVQPGEFDHNVLDNCATRELTPPKTHWARTIDTAPYFAYPLRPGITFTYLSVVVDEHARIIMQDDKPSANMYAAGEIMSGNVLGKGYLGGFGMALGTVFGRIAGEEAARHAGK